MNICLVSWEYPPETFNGIGTYTYNLSHALSDLGHKVFVVSYTRDKEREYVDRGVHVFRVGWDIRGIWRLEKFLPVRLISYSFKVAMKLQELIELHDIDIVEGPELRAELLWYSFKPIVPFVIKFHSPRFLIRKLNALRSNLYEKIRDHLEKRTALSAIQLTSPSFSLANIVAQEYRLPPESIEVIPNPIDLELFSLPYNKSEDGRLTILYVGRLERIKGVDVLVKAIPKVLKQLPVAEFILIGADSNTGVGGISLKQELFSFLQKYNCMDKVKFIDRQERKSLVKFYQNCDIFVVPSLYESFSYTCLEAMACCKPVIGSNVGGLSEIIQDNVSGVLIPPGDSTALAEALIKLGRDRNLRERLGMLARRQVEERYSRERVAEQTIRLYERVVEKFRK